MSNKENISELYKLYESRMQPFLITEEITDTRHQIIAMTDEFNKSLSNEQQKLLQDLLELEHHRGALEDEQVFIYAFTLAIKLLLSGLIYDDKEVIELCKKV